MTEDQFNKLSTQLYATQVLAVALAKLFPSQERLRQQFGTECETFIAVLRNMSVPQKRLNIIRHELTRLRRVLWEHSV